MASPRQGPCGASECSLPGTVLGPQGLSVQLLVNAGVREQHMLPAQELASAALPLDTGSQRVRQGHEEPKSLQPTSVGPWNQSLETQPLCPTAEHSQAALDSGQAQKHYGTKAELGDNSHPPVGPHPTFTHTELTTRTTSTRRRGPPTSHALLYHGLKKGRSQVQTPQGPAGSRRGLERLHCADWSPLWDSAQERTAPRGGPQGM